MHFVKNLFTRLRFLFQESRYKQWQIVKLTILKFERHYRSEGFQLTRYHSFNNVESVKTMHMWIYFCNELVKMPQ